MSYELHVLPQREDRVSLYSRLNIPTLYIAQSFEEAQQLAHILFDLYEFKELPLWQNEWLEGLEYSIEGEGFLIEIKKI